ncbi:MAG: hypothetical protein M1608_16510 [Candidatus Omnitrophica bacterium]|nr:hypothetical protein [Candidatus Omnitrophota bacterium]
MKSSRSYRKQGGFLSYELVIVIVVIGILAVIALNGSGFLMGGAKSTGVKDRVNNIYSLANVYRSNNAGSYTGISMAVLQGNAYGGTSLSSTNTYGGTTTVTGAGATLTITEPTLSNDCEKVMESLNGSGTGWASTCAGGTLTAAITG